MNRISTADIAALALVFLASCAVSQGQDETSTGTALTQLEAANALNPNALNPNALNPNALDPGSLSQAALSALRDPGEAGDLSRELLNYVVSCAFTPAQSFRFSWTDQAGSVHEELYPGLIGLAPSWSNKPLGQTDQQWVSACLASRTNWYGISVTISSRGSHQAIDKAGAPELSTYTRQEGAFWGNLFDSSPYLHACHDDASHARSLSRACAAGHLDENGDVEECGMIHVVGPCDSHCLPLNQRGMYYPSCVNNLTGSPDATTRVITVFLP